MRKRWAETLYRLAQKDPRITFVGSDLTADSLFRKFSAELPKQFFMEGISEAHIIGMAAGLAASGKIVYVNTIATFLTRRCYEQNAIDLGLAQARVRLIGNGGGLVYAPLGPTHLATEDIAIMRAIPQMSVVVPADADEMERAIESTIEHPGPIYFRVAKGGDPILTRPEMGFSLGRAQIHRPAQAVTIISTGILLGLALRAADFLESRGIRAGVVHLPTLKPVDVETLGAVLACSRKVLTLEEHSLSGGLGTIVAELIAESAARERPVLKRFGLPDLFIDEYGSQASLLERYGLSLEKVCDSAMGP